MTFSGRGLLAYDRARQGSISSCCPSLHSWYILLLHLIHWPVLLLYLFNVTLPSRLLPVLLLLPSKDL